MSDIEDEEFRKQMEVQRLAFERQFGSLEEMGYEDETKKEESDDTEESEYEEKIPVENSSESESEAEEFDSDIEVDVNEQHIKKEPVVKKGPKVISFGSTIKDEVDVFSGVKLTDKMIKEMQNTKKKAVLNHKKNNKPELEDDEYDEETERKNLQNDIELQNFIRDSHLLNSFGGSNFNSSKDVVGKARMKVMESQMKALVSQNKHISNKNKVGIVDGLEKVPINIRKGMITKHKKRIDNYEANAKDNGIVLAKQAKGSFRKIDFTYKKDIERRIGKGVKADMGKNNIMRDKGLKINAIGRSSRNGLVISKNEIKRVTGDGQNRGRGKKGKRK